jgi:hypothetical protein
MSNNALGCSSRWLADCERRVCDVVLVEQKLHPCRLQYEAVPVSLQVFTINTYLRCTIMVIERI